MRLKRGIDTYCLPKGVSQINQAMLRVGQNYYPLVHWNINVLNEGRNFPQSYFTFKHFSIPSGFAMFQQGGRKYLRLSIPAERAWTLVLDVDIRVVL